MIKDSRGSPPQTPKQAGYLVIFAPITREDLSLVCRNSQSADGGFHVPNPERPVA